jgi:type IV pilus assembly protein PilM
MAFLKSIARLVKDPPPEHVFEISEAGIAYAHGTQTGFEPFPHGTLKASPAEDNILKPEAVISMISTLAPPNGSRKRRAAAVLLPDASVRVSVLDFDSFPDPPDEQLSLVRFRVKKTIPFDIESASVSYYKQPGASRKGKIEVVAVTVALEVLARYEAVFRSAGFQPGEITISTLSALSLCHGDEPVVIARLAGNALSVLVVAVNRLKLFRCLALEESTDEEILRVLCPTFAYAEDEIGSPVRRLILCGFPKVPAGLPCETEPLRSRLGAPGAFNAGLLGYLEAAV